VSTPETRRGLHLVAVHVLGRRRSDVTGRFGLRATPGGFGTPAFGPEPETVRVSSMTLVHEVGGDVSAMGLAGATLRELAAFAGADIDAPFAAGADTPPIGDPDLPLGMDPATVHGLEEWFATGWAALDAVLASLPAGAGATTIQLWPEHFDAGTTVTLPSGERVNLGASPGDDYLDGPYAYVGPWGDRRGDPAFWNAPFGAARARTELDTVEAVADFLRTGLRLAAGG